MTGHEIGGLSERVADLASSRGRVRQGRIET